MNGQPSFQILDGVVCDDRFARRLGRALRCGNVYVVLLSPGMAVEDAAARLASNADVHVSILPTLRIGDDGQTVFLHALESHLGIESNSCDDVGEFILENIDRFSFPQGFVVPVEPRDGAFLQAIIKAATSFVDGTKNLVGPTLVVVMA